MTRPRILIGLTLVLVSLGGCVAPATTITAVTPAAADYTPDGTTVAPFPGPAAPVDTPTAAVATDPAAPAPASTEAPGAGPTTQSVATAAPRTTAAKAPTTTRPTTVAPPPPPATTTRPSTVAPPPPATTAKPASPGTVSLQCFAAGSGVTRVILTWTNPGFGASVTVNGHTYPLLNTASTGLGSSAPESPTGHGSCSGTVGGITKTGSY